MARNVTNFTGPLTGLKSGTTRYNAHRRDADDPSMALPGHHRGWDWREVMVGGKKVREYRPKCACRWKAAVYYHSLPFCKRKYEEHIKDIKGQGKLL